MCDRRSPPIEDRHLDVCINLGLIEDYSTPSFTLPILIVFFSFNFHTVDLIIKKTKHTVKSANRVFYFGGPFFL